MYSSGEGVSAYIQDMENTPFDEQRLVNNWDDIFRELKHIRWMRNQLAHETSIDSAFCEQSDIDWIYGFYDSLLNGNDPLATAYKTKQAANLKYLTQSNIPSEYSTTSTHTTKEKSHESFWNKIVSKIKNFFS